jgi:acyl-CoA thioester hydrolase
MARVVIDLPERVAFSTEIRVRLNDINVANHVGNDRFVTYINEAYARCVLGAGLSTKTVSMIMADLALVFKTEAHYGDLLVIAVGVGDFTEHGCCFYYRITKAATGEEVVRAKSGVVFFDYREKRPLPVPEKIRALSDARDK